MILQKTEIQQGNYAPFAKKCVEILNGDKISIRDAGRQIQNRFNPEKMQTVFTVLTKFGERSLNFNQTSLNALIDAFGEKTDDWINKTVNVLIFKQNVSGKFLDVVYLAPDGYEMTENGLTRTNHTAPVQTPQVINPVPSQPYQNNNIPIPPYNPATSPNLNQEEEIRTEDIPF